MGYMGIFYNMPKTNFYLLKGDYRGLGVQGLCRAHVVVDQIVRTHHGSVLLAGVATRFLQMSWKE